MSHSLCGIFPARTRTRLLSPLLRGHMSARLHSSRRVQCSKKKKQTRAPGGGGGTDKRVHEDTQNTNIFLKNTSACSDDRLLIHLSRQWSCTHARSHTYARSHTHARAQGMLTAEHQNIKNTHLHICSPATRASTFHL